MATRFFTPCAPALLGPLGCSSTYPPPPTHTPPPPPPPHTPTSTQCKRRYTWRGGSGCRGASGQGVGGAGVAAAGGQGVGGAGVAAAGGRGGRGGSGCRGAGGGVRERGAGDRGVQYAPQGLVSKGVT
jgi:hypothetical protein